MTVVLAVDPGSERSGWAVLDTATMETPAEPMANDRVGGSDPCDDVPDKDRTAATPEVRQVQTIEPMDPVPATPADEEAVPWA